MTPPETGKDFLELLRLSHLLAERVCERAAAVLDAVDARSGDAEQAAQLLVQCGLITAYQSEHLLCGRYRGFYVGHYKLLEVIGRGGMGKVYLAEHIRLHRPVALKVARADMLRNSERTLMRFAREARAMATLKHPNICQAYDFADVGGVPYLVMEYVEGIDLERVVRGRGPIYWKQAADIVCQAAAGLQHAHDAGLVHRDITPANLLLELDGFVKLLDLGLVSEVDAEGAERTPARYERPVGTYDYIAPEQAEDAHQADIRADIYGLGAVLYSVMSGQKLFPGSTQTDRLKLTREREPAPIRTLVADIPRQLASIVRKMLSKRPEDRFQTAAEVEDVLRPFAKRKIPPYKPAMVRLQRQNIAPCLGHSPGPDELFKVQEQLDIVAETVSRHVGSTRADNEKLAAPRNDASPALSENS